MLDVRRDLGHAITSDLLGTLDLLIVLDSGVTQLRSSSGNKDLVSGQVSSSGMMLAVLIVSEIPNENGGDIQRFA